MKAWTEDRIEFLKELWRLGVSTGQIAKRLGGVTKNAVVGKVHRLKLDKRPSPLGAAGRIWYRFDAGKSVPLNVARRSSLDVMRVLMERRGATAAVSRLGSCTCRWPVGDPRSDSFNFCCEPTEGRQTYCKTHAAMAYGASSRSRSSTRAVVRPTSGSREALPA